MGSLGRPNGSDFCTFDEEFGVVVEIGHLQPEFDLDGRLGVLDLVPGTGMWRDFSAI